MILYMTRDFQVKFFPFCICKPKIGLKLYCPKPYCNFLTSPGCIHLFFSIWRILQLQCGPTLRTVTYSCAVQVGHCTKGATSKRVPFLPYTSQICVFTVIIFLADATKCAVLTKAIYYDQPLRVDINHLEEGTHCTILREAPCRQPYCASLWVTPGAPGYAFLHRVLPAVYGQQQRCGCKLAALQLDGLICQLHCCLGVPDFPS